MKRLAKVIVKCVTIVLALAALSYMTTGRRWDGGFPASEIRINVRDENGRPIENAELHVYRGGTRQFAYGYPIANHIVDARLISDESGSIVAVQERSRLQFGGYRWELFWFIPMGTRSGPRFDCEIAAPGYQIATFDIWRLFESPHKMYEKFRKTKRMVQGKEKELIVFDRTVTLRR